MNKRQARIAAAVPAAFLVAVLGATAALAATTWTIKPGGAITASAPRASWMDTKTGNKLTCDSMSVKATLKSGSGLSGSGAGSISAFGFNHCTGPLGITITLTATDLPWHLNLSADNNGVVTGSISHMHIKLMGPSCTAVIDGTSATAGDGHIRFHYADGAGHLTTLSTGGDLHFYNVSGCAGLINTGDPMTISANFPLSPRQAITSP